MIAATPLGRLTASSSRRMTSAREFADRHGATLAFDDWKKLCESVLAEKPFASADSVRRVVAACRDNDVAFMDGTHFVHHPRTHTLKREALVSTPHTFPWKKRQTVVAFES